MISWCRRLVPEGTVPCEGKMFSLSPPLSFRAISVKVPGRPVCNCRFGSMHAFIFSMEAELLEQE